MIVFQRFCLLMFERLNWADVDFNMLCPFSAWIKVEQLKPYHPHKEEMIKINKGKRFQQAVDAVEEYLKKAKGKDQVSMSTKRDPFVSGVNSDKRMSIQL